MKILIKILFLLSVPVLVIPSASGADESIDSLILGLEEAYSQPALRETVGDYGRDLISRGDESLPFIVNALKRGDLSAPAQSALLYILGEIGDEEIAPDLTELLFRKDIARNARIRISKLLEKWESREAIPVMIDLAGDKDEDRNLRIVNIRTLGKWQEKTALAHLAKIALDEEDEPFVRYKAIQVLENYSQPQAVDTLIDVLARPIQGEGFLAERAIIALGKKQDNRATDTLINLSQRDLPPILKKRCILSLGEIGDPRAIPVLRKFLNGNNRMLQDYSAQVIEKITGQQVAVPLLPEEREISPKLFSGPEVKTE